MVKRDFKFYGKRSLATAFIRNGLCNRCRLKSIAGTSWRNTRHKLLVSTLLSLTTICSGSTPGGGIAYRDLEKAVLQKDSAVRAILLRRQALEYRLSATRAQFLPQLGATYRYTSDGFDLTDEQFDPSASFNLRLSQDIFRLWKVRPGRLREVRTELEISYLEVRDGRGLALLRFRQTYLELLQSRARALHYQKLIDIYDSLTAIQRTRFQNNEGLMNSILDAEKQRGHFRMLLAHHEKRVANLTHEMSALFEIDQERLLLDDVKIPNYEIDAARLEQIARRNSYPARVNQAKADIENSLAGVAPYQDLRVAPYLGLNFRGNNTVSNALPRTSSEIGLRVTFPIFQPLVMKRTRQRYHARAAALRSQAEADELATAQRVSLLHDKFVLWSEQIADLGKMIEWRQEKLRIGSSNFQTVALEQGFDRAQVLFERAEVVKAQLQYQLNLYERAAIFYELLYQSGLRWPHELPATSTLNTPGPARLERAMWLWRGHSLLGDTEAVAELLSFCQQQGITQIYFSVNKQISTSAILALALQRLITACHRSHIKVSALMGDPGWVHSTGRRTMTKRFNFVFQFNQSVAAESRFDAIHLDIEPHALDEWPRHQTELLDKLVETVEIADRLMRKHAPAMPLELDVPPLYWRRGRPHLQSLMKIADNVTLMAYSRNTSRKIFNATNVIVEAAEKMGAKVVIGVNAKDFSKAADLNILMQEVASRFLAEHAFSGMAIHDYDQFKRMITR